MKKTLIASLLAASFGFAATASAGELTDSFTVTYDVPAACVMLVNEKDIALEMAFTEGSAIDTSASAVQTLDITCNKDLTFTVEFPGADANGIIKLTGETSGDVLDLNATRVDTGAVFGSQANGEAITTVATGKSQEIEIDLSLAPETIPTPDIYSATVDVKLSF